MTAMALLGLAIMIVSEAAALAQIEPFWSWNTPIAWTGFIIFADAVVYRARGHSWIRSSPRELIALAIVSIPLWLVFEWFNRFLLNWHYVGLPENLALRYFGYAWSFATIWPAIFEGAELIGVLRAGRAGQAGTAPHARPSLIGGGAPPPLRTDADASPRHRLAAAQRSRRRSPPALPALSIAAGALMLASPFIAPRIAPYLAAAVWLGFIFLLDPINARLGGEALFVDWRAGHFDRTINLIGSGFLCGVLWELWNYWSRAKWHYTVPIMENLKIFEMPVPGYLGFPAFALECFTMYVFVRLLWLRRKANTTNAPGRPIAL